MKQPIWVRVLAALGILIVGFPSAVLVAMALPSINQGDTTGIALLLCGIIGLFTIPYLRRLGRGELLSRNTMIVTAAGVVISLSGVAVAYSALRQSFDKVYLAHMKIALAGLASDQERYFKQQGRLASDTVQLYTQKREPSYVRITLEHGDSLSWRASAKHDAAPKRTCRIAGTSAAPVVEPLCE